jgi:hypothetical protein
MSHCVLSVIWGNDDTNVHLMCVLHDCMLMLFEEMTHDTNVH